MPRLRPLVGVRFQGLFTPLLGVLFTFPSQYYFAIGLSGVFSLSGWCRQFQTGFLRSRLTQDTNPCELLSCTGLSPPAVASSKRIPLRISHFLSVLQPHSARTMVWAFPLSLATTRGITIVFFSSGYLDVSVPRVVFPCGMLHLQRSGFPHSDIYGYNARLQLPVAFRSLPRPSSSLRA